MAGTLDDEWSKLSTKKDFYSADEFEIRKAYLSGLVDQHGWSASITSFEFNYPTATPTSTGNMNETAPREKELWEQMSQGAHQAKPKKAQKKGHITQKTQKAKTSVDRAAKNDDKDALDTDKKAEDKAVENIDTVAKQADTEDATVAMEALTRLLKIKQSNESKPDEEIAVKLSKGQKKRLMQKKKKAREAEEEKSNKGPKEAAPTSKHEFVSVQNLDKAEPTWGAVADMTTLPKEGRTIESLLKEIIDTMIGDSFWRDLATPVKNAINILRGGTSESQRLEAAEQLVILKDEVAAIYLFQDEQRTLGGVAKFLQETDGAGLQSVLPEDAMGSISVSASKFKSVMNVVDSLCAAGMNIEQWDPEA